MIRYSVMIRGLKASLRCHGAQPRRLRSTLSSWLRPEAATGPRALGSSGRVRPRKTELFQKGFALGTLSIRELLSRSADAIRERRHLEQSVVAHERVTDKDQREDEVTAVETRLMRKRTNDL
jgi:hypothetical protein